MSDGCASFNTLSNCKHVTCDKSLGYNCTGVCFHFRSIFLSFLTCLIYQIFNNRLIEDSRWIEHRYISCEACGMTWWHGVMPKYDIGSPSSTLRTMVRRGYDVTRHISHWLLATRHSVQQFSSSGRWLADTSRMHLVLFILSVAQI